MPRTTEFHDRLLAARQRAGLSPREMSERLMTPRQTYEQWERGARATPGVAVVAAEMIAARHRQERPESLARRIIALADGSRTAGDIAQMVGCAESYVRGTVSRSGGKLSRPSRTKFDIAKIRAAADLVRGGISRQRAVEHVGLIPVGGSISGSLWRHLHAALAETA